MKLSTPQSLAVIHSKDLSTRPPTCAGLTDKSVSNCISCTDVWRCTLSARVLRCTGAEDAAAQLAANPFAASVLHKHDPRSIDGSDSTIAGAISLLQQQHKQLQATAAAALAAAANTATLYTAEGVTLT